MSVQVNILYDKDIFLKENFREVSFCYNKLARRAWQRSLYFWRVSGRCSYQVWKCEPAARYPIYGVGQQGKGLLSAGHGYLQIINQGSFQ